jgi:hypothetical protein
MIVVQEQGREWRGKRRSEEAKRGGMMGSRLGGGGGNSPGFDLLVRLVVHEHVCAPIRSGLHLCGAAKHTVPPLPWLDPTPLLDAPPHEQHGHVVGAWHDSQLCTMCVDAVQSFWRCDKRACACVVRWECKTTKRVVSVKRSLLVVFQARLESPVACARTTCSGFTTPPQQHVRCGVLTG